MSDLISVCLAYFLIGSVLWAVRSEHHRDFVVREWTRRRGVLPGRGVLFLSIVRFIVQWPKLARVLWRGA
jgi:hypothetical protein